ncbi:MAG: hypothetical protein M9954_03355 [Cyclobacteriaceae bacterium]|nr:hypothetical protein [Cyclobacteriaceae bacterium]
MRSFISSIPLFSICLILAASCCKDNGCDPKCDTVVLTGRVLAFDGKGIEGAKIIVYPYRAKQTDDKCVRTGESANEGGFKIMLPESGSFVVSISKQGFGMVSEILDRDPKSDSLQGGDFFLNEATVQTINAATGGTVTVINTKSYGSAAYHGDWTKIPTGTLPFVFDDSGRVSGFTMPAELRGLWEAQYFNRMDLSAARVTIPGNSLVNAVSGASAQGNVQVALAALDVFTERGMPGNDVAYDNGQRPGTMQSLGAISIQAYNDEATFNLDPKNEIKATLTMPIPEWRLKLQSEFPESVPLLYYDEKAGVWNQHGDAFYNDSLKAYTARLDHFSSINVDIIKSGPSAAATFTFDQTCPGPQPTELHLPFDVELLTQDIATTQVYVRNRAVTGSDCGTGDTPCFLTDLTGLGNNRYAFSLNRLPVNSPASVTFFDGSSSTVKGLAVFKTSATGHQEITDGLGAVPTCAEIRNHGTASAVAWTYDPRQVSFQTNNDFMIAVCWDGGANYHLSLASEVPGFDVNDANGDGTATDPVTFTSVNAEDVAATSLCDATIPITFTQISNTTTIDTTPGATGPIPKWRVYVFQVPIGQLCTNGGTAVDPATIDTFRFQFSYGGTGYNLSAKLSKNCVFTP